MSSPGSGSSSNRGPRHTEVCVLPIAKHKRFHLIIHDFNIQHIPSPPPPHFIRGSCQVRRSRPEELINYIFALCETPSTPPLCV